VTVHLGKFQIQQNDVGTGLIGMLPFLAQKRHGLDAVPGAEDFVGDPRFAKATSNQMGMRVVIFHKQKSHQFLRHHISCVSSSSTRKLFATYYGFIT
jgi:hypothetical protein